MKTNTIRVRVWDGVSILYPNATKTHHNHYLQLGEVGFWIWNEKGDLITSHEKGGELMLFTGFYDKDLNPIYEGDLVKEKEGRSWTDVSGVVGFDYGRFGVEWDKEGEGYSTILVHSVDYRDDGKQVLNHIKITGNIFNN